MAVIQHWKRWQYGAALAAVCGVLLLGYAASGRAAQQPSGAEIEAAGQEIQQALAEGDPDAALTLADRALDRYQDLPEVVVQMSRLKAAALRQGERPLEALPVYADLLTRYPGSEQKPAVLWEQANLLDQVGQREAAIQSLRQIIDTCPFSPQRIQAHRGLADVYGNLGKVDEAWTELHTLATQFAALPVGGEALLGLARLQLQRGAANDALTTLQNLRQQRPLDHVAWQSRWLLAEALSAAGRLDDAVKRYEEIATDRPEMETVTEAVMSQVNHLQQAGRNKEATEALEKLRKRFLDTWVEAEALLRSARVNAQADVEASLTLDTLIEKMPTSSYVLEARMMRADLALQGNDVDTAREHLQAVLKAVPQTPLAAQAQMQMAQAYLQAKDVVTAVAALDVLLKDYPGPPFAMQAQRLKEQIQRQAGAP